MSTDGRHAALRRLGELDRPWVAAHFGVRSLRVFGSVARGDIGPNSDLDVLVDLGGPQSQLDKHLAAIEAAATS
jgi:predicted nucleotidyltransferase